MRKVALFTIVTLFSIPAHSEILSCDALKARVDAKLQAKGVQTYTLEIEPITASNNNAASATPATTAKKGKEVGTCDGATKRLIYTKGN
jgi:hypothetical protein